MRICFFVNHTVFFCSHRLPIARALLAEGHEVHLIAGQSGSESMTGQALSKLANVDITLHSIPMSSDSVNPIREFLAFCILNWHLWQIQPDILHCASPKANLYGSISARLMKIKKLVLAISGQGYINTRSEVFELKRWVLGLITRHLIRLGLGHSNIRVIVQNKDDFCYFKSKYDLPDHSLFLVPGSGVDFSLYPLNKLTRKNNIVLFPARLLIDKGIREFLEAAHENASIFPNWKFLIAGAIDYQNPSAISMEEINEWSEHSHIEFLGFVENIHQLYLISKIVCLPSYREGMPKSLLEAAAAQCAIITTDTVGCREAIKDGETGLLIPTRDSRALSKALFSLMSDEIAVKKLGKNGRAFAENQFEMNLIVKQIIDIYNI